MFFFRKKLVVNLWDISIFYLYVSFFFFSFSYSIIIIIIIGFPFFLYFLLLFKTGFEHSFFFCLRKNWLLDHLFTKLLLLLLLAVHIKKAFPILWGKISYLLGV